MTIAVLAGGVGAARLLRGMVLAVDPREVTAIVNVADDVELHGLHISPDLDTVTYTLAGVVDTEKGWGLAGETWEAMEVLGRYTDESWFNLGDRDLGTHLHRTSRLIAGAALSEVTAEVVSAWGISCTVLPATDDRLRTRVKLSGGDEVGFQDYFVRLRHDVAVEAVRFDGASTATPAPGVLESISSAEAVVIAPSNPIVSIGPILAIPGLEAALERRRDSVWAISPIVAGAALKGPADRLMTELGHEASVVGVARLYRNVAAGLVIDEADAELAPAVEAEGVRCVVAPTIMRSPGDARDLSRLVLACAGAALPPPSTPERDQCSDRDEP